MLALGISKPRLDDRGRHQHVIFAVVELVHPLIQIARRKLAVRDDIADLRHMGFQEILDLVQIRDPRHHVEALAPAEAFAQQGLADGDGVEFGLT